jgi:hypothetical protein
METDPMTTPQYDPSALLSPSMTTAEAVALLKYEQWAIRWALEHLPHELNEFLPDLLAHEDPYQWAINMTQWVEEVRTRKELADDISGKDAS